MTATPSRAILLLVGLALLFLAGAGFAGSAWGDVHLGGSLLAWHAIVGLLAAGTALVKHDYTARHWAVALGLLALGISIVVGSSRITSGFTTLDATIFGVTGITLLLGGFLHGTGDERPTPRLSG